MKITIQTIGNALIEFETKDEKEAISKMAFFQSLPAQCGICGAPVSFSHRQPQGYDYYGLVCEGSPKHESNFGQNKEGGKLFYKGDWREVQYNSVAAERDAEINKFSDLPAERIALMSRITKANEAIKQLGGQVDRVNLDSMNEKELRAELDSLINQYNRLKGNK